MNLLRLIVAGLFLAPLVSRPAAAQALDPTFTSPTGVYAPGLVFAMGPQQADGKRVVAGNFLRVNSTSVSQLVRLDAAGALDQAFSQNVGTASNIFRVRSLPSGQYLLGANGGAVSAGGISRTELLRLNANGTADASFNVGAGPAGGNSYVQEYAVQPDGKIVVVGSFDTFNGVPANGVVRLNANGSVDPSFGVGVGIDVNSTTSYNQPNTVAVQPDGKIVVGGEFATFSGQPVNGLVRLTATGAIDVTFSSPLQQNPNQTNSIEAVVIQPDGKVLVQGYLAGSQQSLVRLLPLGSLDASFSAATFTSNTTTTNLFDPAIVLQSDGKIVVVGYFTAPGANRVARLNSDGSQDFSFQAVNGPDGTPYTVGVQANGSVLVGGTFNSFNGTETPLGRFTSTGTPDAAFAPRIQVSGSALAVVRQADGKLLVGGNFTEINGQAVHRLARLSAAGVLDAGFSASTGVLPAPVTSLALQPDGKLLVGTSRGVLRMATTGSPDPGFAAFAALSTSALAVQADGRIMVAGSFGGSANGVSYDRLLRLTSTGSYDPTFARNTLVTSPTGALYYADALLVQPDGRIVVGANFRTSTSSSQTYTGRVVRYETNGTLDATFNNQSAFTATSGVSGTTNRVYSLALQPDGKILAGGNFGAVDGTLHYGVARLSPTGTPDAGFVPDALLTGTVYSVALQPNGRVLLGGSFSNSGATSTLVNLARVLSNGQTDVSFGIAAAPNGSVRSLLVQPDGAIVLAGSFNTIGSTPSAGVARISAPNVLAVAAPAAVAARTAAWPVPAHGLLHRAPDVSAHPFAVELLDALGRLVRSQAVANAPEVTMNLENLPAGVYVLRVSYAAGAVTRRLVVE